MVKTQKIVPGLYKGCYKGINFQLKKVGDLPASKIAWYWQIAGRDVSDWHSSKSVALAAVVDFIDEPC
jgi:hypothetical protein